MAKAKPFDAAEYLDSPEMIAAYINEALESEDTSATAVAIGTVARARGMSAVAEKADSFARIFIGHWAVKRSRNSLPSLRCFMRSESIWLPNLRDRRRHRKNSSRGFWKTRFHNLAIDSCLARSSSRRFWYANSAGAPPVCRKMTSSSLRQRPWRIRAIRPARPLPE